ncbi:hypothetical protein RGUI_1327 [Rhodovulum sp. P5]|uniref:hypothetical protein n=1 Tax=Rhodovulum sp. P5 TaxID=1564506 RepID=UPI0009C1B5E7|nr:hypothetical protein [Rhodovulum sp. P5]ARE39468.1 hypothetical protein RGUI_1327 [Rhodovulum sp. P5]
MNWGEAESIIGRQAPDDYILSLDTHERLYRETAPDLVWLIALAGLRSEAETYTRFDGQANRARSTYMRWMLTTNLGTFLTSVLSAGAMAWGLLGIKHDALTQGLLGHGALGLTVAATVSAAVASAGLLMLRQGRLLENWMRKRATAETHRVGYFEGLLKRASETSQDATLLALEYFRRYQFEVQKNYFFHRARDHEASANKTVLVGAIGAFVATFSNLAGAFSGQGVHATGAISVLGAALGAYAIGREQMTQDRRNAERYDRTYSALVALAGLLDEVREAVSKGNLGLARDFAAAVDEQVTNEHRQWLEATEAAKAALIRIEDALRSTGDKEAAT